VNTRGGQRTAPRTRSLTAAFDLDHLATVRHAMVDSAMAYGLTGPALDGFVLAANEIVANAIAHGGGRGRLRLWSDGHLLRCQVSDNGPGLPTEYRDPQRPPLSASCGRGLWLARQFCQLDIRTSAYGTTIELTTPAPR